jgi:hypothetical protein
MRKTGLVLLILSLLFNCSCINNKLGEVNTDPSLIHVETDKIYTSDDMERLEECLIILIEEAVLTREDINHVMECRKILSSTKSESDSFSKYQAILNKKMFIEYTQLKTELERVLKSRKKDIEAWKAGMS